MPWLLSTQPQPSREEPHARTRGGGGKGGSTGGISMRLLAMRLPARFLTLMASQHDTVARAVAAGSAQVHVPQAYADERAQRLLLVRALLRGHGGAAAVELANAGFGAHVVRVLLPSRALVEVSTRVPVSFLPHNNSFVLREEGIDMLAEAVAARASAPELYASVLAHLKREDVVFTESTRLQRRGEDPRMVAGALRLLRVLALLEDEDVTTLMHAADTAEHAFALYRAVAALGGGSDPAAPRPLRANKPATSRAGKGQQPTREQLAVGVAARLYLEALWAYEKRALRPHLLLTEAMRAAEPLA
ncbi:hypothetical protein T492DRAFT_969720 [Pavlovales sp. CCMP2436]|nr:hypothetical protein T492DRAFT_969720 [Pavlovales sp. CCMP2436]